MAYQYERLERARLELGLTYTELARLAGVSGPTATRCLRGESANPPTIKAVADVLGVDMADLVEAST